MERVFLLNAYSVAETLILSLSIGKSSVTSTSECRIGPLSPLFQDFSRSRVKASIENGKFAILVINDGYDTFDCGPWVRARRAKAGTLDTYKEPYKGVRYAFVTPKANAQGLNIMDVPEFLDRVAQEDSLAFASTDTPDELKAYWTRQVNQLSAISLCANDEAYIIANKAFGEDHNQKV